MKYPKDRCQYVRPINIRIADKLFDGYYWCDLSDNPCDPYTRGEGECETLEEQMKEEEDATAKDN